MQAVPRVGDFDCDDVTNFDTEKDDWRKIKTECPHCRKQCCPMLLKKLEQTDSGWRWVGCDHREPYAEFIATHSCGGQFRFSIHWPQ